MLHAGLGHVSETVGGAREGGSGEVLEGVSVVDIGWKARCMASK